MSLLLGLRQTVQGGSGTILLLTQAFGTPLAARQPLWLGADEAIVAAPAVALDDGAWLPSVPAQSGRVALVLTLPDELSPTGILSGDDWTPPVLYVIPPSSLPLWLGATDDVATQPVGLDDGAAFVPLAPALIPPSLFRGLGFEDGFPAVIAQPLATEEGWLPRVQPPQYQRLLLASSPAVLTPIAAVGNPSDEWHYQQFLPPPAPIVLFGPWSYGVAEDTASLLVAEDEWQPRVVWPAYRRVLLVGGMAPHAVHVIAFPTEEHAAALPLVAPVPVTLFGPWSYGVSEDTSALLQGDEGLWLPPLVRPATWARLVVVQSDELPFVLTVTEDQWLCPLVRPAPTARLILTLPDERPSIVAIGVTEDYWLASFLPNRHIVRVPVAMLPPWAYEQREQGFGLVVPPIFEGRGQVIPRTLWERGPHLWTPGFRRG